MLSNSLEHRDDVTPIFAWLDSAAVDKHTWSVDSGHCHCAAWHILVTATDSDETVEAFSADDGFNGVRNDFTRHQ